MKPAETEDKTCSRCEGELDTTGYPRWCKKCRATNQREYNRTIREMSETRGFAAGFAAGAAAMRVKIVSHCQGLGSGRFPGAMLAGWIAKLSNPKP